MTQPEAGMQVDCDATGTALSLAFPDRVALRVFFDQTLRQRAFLLSLPLTLPPFARVACTVSDAQGFRMGFAATVVHTFADGDAHQVAFQLEEWDAAKTADLEHLLGAAAPPASPTAGSVEAQDETFGTAPVFRIKALDLPQKILLALKADRVERQVLCREPSPMVLLNLLNNPRLESENVLAIVKSTYATPDIFQRVAADKRWMASAEIRTAVVRNPKTPTPIATRLLETLSLHELRDMAKMGALKEDLRQAAFRIYTRMSRRR